MSSSAQYRGHGHAHESPRVMTMPLAILAFFAVAARQRSARRHGRGSAHSLKIMTAQFEIAEFDEPALLVLMLTSSRGRLSWPWPRLVALRQQVAAC